MRSDLIAWAGVAAVLTVSPGADMAIVARQALTVSPRAARRAAAGISAGVLAWGALSALGVAALVATSATAYHALRVAGAAYLVVLGVRALLAARAAWRSDAAPAGATAGGGGSPAFRQGLLTNLLNPKVGVFYAAVLPQFVAPGDPVLALSMAMAAIHAALSLAWLNAYAWLLGRARGVLGRPRTRAAIEAVTGAVLIGLGIRVAVERAP